jgi:hypothetical protein
VSELKPKLKEAIYNPELLLQILSRR